MLQSKVSILQDDLAKAVECPRYHAWECGFEFPNRDGHEVICSNDARACIRCSHHWRVAMYRPSAGGISDGRGRITVQRILHTKLADT